MTGATRPVWPSVPALLAASEERHAAAGRGARRRDDIDVPRTRRRSPTVRRRLDRVRRRPGRPGGHLVLQLRRVGGGRPRHLRRRCRTGPGEYALQGSRGRRDLEAEQRPDIGDRHRLSRDRLPGAARGCGRGTPGARNHGARSRPRGPGRGPRGGLDNLSRTGHTRSARGGRAPKRGHSDRTILPTSSSPREPPAYPRAWS